MCHCTEHYRGHFPGSSIPSNGQDTKELKTGSAGSTEWVETSVVQDTEDGLWTALHNDRNSKHTTKATMEWLKTSVLWKEDEVAGGQPRT